MDEAQDLIEGTTPSSAARVVRTGIALVHEGEIVLPADGSEAEAEQVAEDTRTAIEYHFPVEVEIRSLSDATDLNEIVELTLRRLTAGLSGV